MAVDHDKPLVRGNEFDPPLKKKSVYFVKLFLPPIMRTWSSHEASVVLDLAFQVQGRYLLPCHCKLLGSGICLGLAMY